jgi:hypothetical protein
MNIKKECRVESEMILTFVKDSAPKGSHQVIIPMFRDVIDKELHCDQIERLSPPLIKLPQGQRQVAPVSTSLLPSPGQKKN